jgi:DNA-binding transcriptional ArsR family regulator
MVKHAVVPLDRTFAALADPTRRALLWLIAKQPGVTVTALADPFAMSLPAIIKHLGVLSEAGLVVRTKLGRTVACRPNDAPMRDAAAWLIHCESFWSEGLHRLALLRQEEERSSSSRKYGNPRWSRNRR